MLLQALIERLSKRFGGEKGCRHITDLLAYAGTIAYQTLWKEKTGGEAENITLEEAKSIEKKFADSCFAFKRDGEVYNQYREILIGKLEKN